MVWNTIAHPKMMDGSHSGGGSADISRTYSPIKFADPHKLSFYDIIVSVTGTTDDQQVILVKGDFETLKRMILNNEAVCGAMFDSAAGGSTIAQKRSDFVAVEYSANSNTIAFATNDRVCYLSCDNTVETKILPPPSAEDDPADGR